MCKHTSVVFTLRSTRRPNCEQVPDDELSPEEDCLSYRESKDGVHNHHLGKNVSLYLFESCSHQGSIKFLHSFTFVDIAYPCSAVNSVHKLATNYPGFFN